MVIDATYFHKGETYIPNARDVNTAGVGGSENTTKKKLEAFIDKYERSLLINALGATQYFQLNTILDEETLEEVGNEKWKFLVDGETYTKDDKTYRWEGLRGFSQQSLVAYYVFCKYLRENDVVYTTVGTVKNIAKNSVSIAATPRYVGIWNKFVLAYQGKENSLSGVRPRIITNRSGEIGFSYYNEEGVERSLYQYLTDKNDEDEANFPALDDFKFYKRENSMGI